MTPERYQQLTELFTSLCELNELDRAARLAGVAAEDPELCAELEVLLARDRADQFLTRTSLEVRSEALVESATLPRFLARYRIIRLLGEGGMGAAYEAEQENPHRRVAVKTLRAAMRTPRMLRRFEYEAQILGRLRHPGIAQVYEAGVADTPHGKLPFIAMELVHGRLLDEIASQMTLRERVTLFAVICDAVQHAHQQGVIHRDLKPGNILVEHDADGVAHPKILDFGVARLNDPEDNLCTQRTEPGVLIGTLPYMSPEQVADGGSVDTRTDVYSLGVILFELLTGRTPLDMKQRSVAEAIRMIVEQEAPPVRRLVANLPADLETICAKALHKEPGHRYQAASELAEDIRHFLRDEPINARAATMLYQIRKFARRHRGPVAAASAALLAIIAAAVVSIAYARAEHAAREQTTAALARAEAEERRVSWTNYRLHLAAAESDLESEPSKAFQSLEAAPPAFRNWEWRHLRRRLNSTLATAEGDPGSVAAVAFRGGTEAIAALVRGGAIEIVELSSGATRTRINSSPSLSRPALSADGARVAVWCAENREIRVFETQTAEQVAQWPLGAEVLKHQLGHDGRRIVAAVVGRGLEILDTASNVACTVTSADIRYLSYGILAVDDAGELIASSGATQPDFPHTGVWEVESGRRRDYTFVDSSALAFRPGHTDIALGGNNRLAVVDPFDGRVKRPLRGRDARWTSLSWSPDGIHLAGAGGGATAQLFDCDSGMAGRSILLPFTARQLALSSDGSALAAAYEHQVALSRTSEPGVVKLSGHTSFVYLVAWSPDGKMLASAGWDLCVRLWNHDGAAIAVLPVDGKADEPIHGLAFSKGGTSVLALSHHAALYEWEVAGGRRITPSSGEPQPRRAEALQQYWSEARGGARFAATDGGERETSSTDGTLVARCGPAGQVTVSSREDGREHFRIDAHAGRALAVAFSPDGKLLATGGSDSQVRLWRINDGAPAGTLTGHTGALYSLAFSPDGTRLASGSSDTAIVVWDLAHLEPVVVLRGHNDYVHAVSFSPDGSQLASASGDGTVRIWQAQ